MIKYVIGTSPGQGQYYIEKRLFAPGDTAFSAPLLERICFAAPGNYIVKSVYMTEQEVAPSTLNANSAANSVYNSSKAANIFIYQNGIEVFSVHTDDCDAGYASMDPQNISVVSTYIQERLCNPAAHYGEYMGG